MLFLLLERASIASLYLIVFVIVELSGEWKVVRLGVQEAVVVWRVKSMPCDCIETL